MPAFGPLFEARFGLPPAADGAAEQTISPVMEGLLTRGVCRSYDTARPVEPATLEMLLACAQSAPSKSDLNQYSIIVVREQEKKDFVATLLPEMAWIADCGVFFLFCADIRRGKLVAQHHALDHKSDTLDSFMNASVDAVSPSSPGPHPPPPRTPTAGKRIHPPAGCQGRAMMAFIASAESLGLGCCPISAVREHLHALCPAFDVPDGVFPICGLCCGWPSEPDPRRVTLRPPPSAVVHWGSCEPSTPAIDPRHPSVLTHLTLPFAP